ncbi:hypothetical protein D044_0306A, partial [Vibrio parahaemolyticus EKP-026]
MYLIDTRSDPPYSFLLPTAV